MCLRGEVLACSAAQANFGLCQVHPQAGEALTQAATVVFHLAGCAVGGDGGVVGGVGGDIAQVSWK